MSHKRWIIGWVVKIIALNLLVGLAAAGWAWYSGNTSTAMASNIFFAGGAMFIVFGSLSRSGRKQPGGWKSLMAESSTLMSLTEKNGEVTSEISKSYSFLVTFVSAGVVSVGIGVLLGQF